MLRNSRNSSTIFPEGEIISFGCAEETGSSWVSTVYRLFVFPQWISRNITTQLSVSHISAGGGRIERIVKMTNHALCLCVCPGRKQAQFGDIMVGDAEENFFFEVWVE